MYEDERARLSQWYTAMGQEKKGTNWNMEILPVRMTEHCAQRDYGILLLRNIEKPSGNGPGHLALCVPAGVGSNRHRGPYQPQQFCDAGKYILSQ